MEISASSMSPFDVRPAPNSAAPTCRPLQVAQPASKKVPWDYHLPPPSPLAAASSSSPASLAPPPVFRIIPPAS